MTEPKSVCIIGAGIGGLASAILLSRIGMTVQLFEQAPKFGPVGAGILVPPAGQSVLKALEVYDVVRNSSAIIESVRAELKGGRRLLDLHYKTLGSERFALGTPRSVLFEALLNRALENNVKIQCGKRLKDVVSENDRNRFIFEDGSEIYSSDFSFVVVTDGSKSKIGTKLGINRVSCSYNHEAMWLIGNIGDYKQSYLLQRMSSVRRLTGLLPLGNSKAGFFWGVRKDEEIYDLEKFRNEALEIIPEAKSIIEAISSPSEFSRTGYRMSLHYPWHRNNIVLLGDAARSMSPHLGQGASLALLDALSFSNSVEKFPNDFERACRSYESDRFFRSLYCATVSAVASPFFQSDWSWLSHCRDATLPLLAKNNWIRSQMVATMSGTKTSLLKTESHTLIDVALPKS